MAFAECDTWESIDPCRSFACYASRFRTLCSFGWSVTLSDRRSCPDSDVVETRWVLPESNVRAHRAGCSQLALLHTCQDRPSGTVIAEAPLPTIEKVLDQHRVSLTAFEHANTPDGLKETCVLKELRTGRMLEILCLNTCWKDVVSHRQTEPRVSQLQAKVGRQYLLGHSQR